MMKKIIFIFSLTGLFLMLALTSCDDWFDLHPQSESILEDYWRDESDVKSVVASCYRAMNEIGFMERLLIWGEVRSDNVIQGSTQNTDIDHFLNLTLNATNGYTSWNEFYRVINYCNTVIYYAPAVREKDPNFTEGQLRAYLAEVKGIRALCYFTLVRTFRDIPFLTAPTFDDSESFEAPQSNPDVIIRTLIDDLKEIQNSAIAHYEDVLYDKGRITRKAIWALIADMSLWINDYQTCIDYCDKVLNPENNLSWESSQTYYQRLFVTGLSNESIFELRFNALQNFAATEMYSMYSGNGRSGQNVYRVSAFDFNSTTPLFGTTDLRAKDFFGPLESGRYPVMKYAAYRSRINSSGAVYISDYAPISCWHWIFYRLSDIYLMKAEALVERGDNQADREAAFACVTKTYDRANPDLGEGSLNFSAYNTQTAMRNLVFDERQREFLFEGKRYFDLLRRIKREGDYRNVVSTYLFRKYMHLDQATVRSKINDEDALYMPINETELKNNRKLVQNPFYKLSSDINKN
jgi:hypothetical protein